MKARKVHAGSYEYTAGGLTVEVFSIPGNAAYGDPERMWVARAMWDRHMYSDPLNTKRRAVDAARAMLNEKMSR